LLLSALAAAVGAAAWVWQHREIPIATTEREPNDIPAQANALPPGRAVSGFLGRRMSTRFSDADVYALANPGNRPRFLRFSVSAIPNMDLVVDVVRADNPEPIVRVDGAPLGAGESVPALPFDGSAYYLRVRENWREGLLPTENISDSYAIRWDFVEPGASDEREVNDSAERANGVRLGVPRTGYIGWNDDRDVYCLEADAPRVQARVSGVEGLDLVLESVERVRGVTVEADTGGVGAPEQLPPVLEAPAQQTCFVVRANTARGGARAGADAPYTLMLETADVPPPAPEFAPVRTRGRGRGRGAGATRGGEGAP
jgi:hypothetical protein